MSEDHGSKSYVNFTAEKVFETNEVCKKRCFQQLKAPYDVIK